LLTWLGAELELRVCLTAASISLLTRSGSKPVCSKYVGSRFHGPGLLVEEPLAEVADGSGDLGLLVADALGGDEEVFCVWAVACLTAASISF
jgi:hypothetical protein